MVDQSQSDLTALTVELVSAFVANNNLRSEDLATLIASTHGALAALNKPAPTADEAQAEEHKPAVTMKKSLADPSHIISMIDGKPYKALKRHLSGHGLDPQSYRERYKLPASYPMVAPGYSEARREVAKRLGLGRKPGGGRQADAPAQPDAAAKPARKPRGRKADTGGSPA